MSDDAKDAEAPVEDEAPVEGEGAEDGEDAPEEAPSGLKAKLAKFKWIIVGALVVLILGGGGAGLYLSGFFTVHKPHDVSLSLPGQPVMHEMPRITVDLTPSAGHARPFIRLLMQAELQGESAKAAFVENETKILDAIQSHLRTVTVQQLQGKEGTETLRSDILTIVNRIIKPERAITVFYKEILIR